MDMGGGGWVDVDVVVKEKLLKHFSSSDEEVTVTPLASEFK